MDPIQPVISFGEKKRERGTHRDTLGTGDASASVRE